MDRPIRVRYAAPDVTPSGMAVEMPDGPDELGRPWPFETSRFTVPPGATSELDQHEVVELWMVRSGTGTVRSGGNEVELGPGDALFFPSWVPHQVTTTSAEPLDVFSVWWRGQPR